MIYYYKSYLLITNIIIYYYKTYVVITDIIIYYFRRFHVIERGTRDGYNTAIVEFLKDDVMQGEELAGIRFSNNHLH